MNPEAVSESKIEKKAFYVLLITAVLAPLAFWPTPYVALDIVKSFVIVVGTVLSAIFYGFVVLKEKKATLPPKNISVTVGLLAVSLVVSALTSIQSAKSLFGQGFESGTASMILIMFLAALVSYLAIRRKTDRAFVIYAALVATYLIIFVFQALRLAFGASFISFSILSSVTSSIFGNWYSLASYSVAVVLVAISALIFLPLSRMMKYAYSILAIVAAFGAFIVNDPRIWLVASLVFLGLSIYMPYSRRSSGASCWKRLSWLPIAALIISAVFVWNGTSISRPIINKMNAGYSELSLPWQMTIDVTAGAIKTLPVFGVGPNHFLQAFLAFKPDSINQSDAWGVEFPYGFGLIPTFFATQGLVGVVLWILLFVFIGIAGARALRRLPEDPSHRFIIVSSYSAAVFLWLMMMVSVPSLTMIFIGFILTGIFFAAATTSGSLKEIVWSPASSTKSYKFFAPVVGIVLVIVTLWGLVYIKKTVALAYFASGVKQLNVAGNAVAADNAFRMALSFDNSDVYWQGRAEAALSQVSKIAASVPANATASTSQDAIVKVNALMNQAFQASQNAINYDPTNYYNYISQARVSEAAISLHMNNGFEGAVAAYQRAIALNPHNPSIYLSLARVQASQNKLPDALKTVGAALQVKNNYLDAVFLLSQIYAAQGDLQNATIAAQVATQLNPQNPLLFFQLGLLQYNNKDYAGAATALAIAIKLQPDYANAQYFLGLADARLGNTADAITQFSQLAKANPDNQEVAQILSTLQSGKSLFVPAQPTTPPEKRASLPIKQKQ